VRPAASRFVVRANSATEITPITTPKTSAALGDTVWLTSGLERVRFMSWSMSRSM
jgi:hypothetical protein